MYNHPVIVVDFGTATTFDIVNEKGEFIGGIIAPGLNLQLKALNKFTSKLPRIEVALSNTAIGHNTTDAILSGVLRGSASMNSVKKNWELKLLLLLQADIQV